MIRHLVNNLPTKSNMSPETKESSLGAFGIGTGAVTRFLVTRPVLGLSRAGAGAAKAEEALRDEVDLAGAIFPGFGKTAIDLRRVAIFNFCFE